MQEFQIGIVLIGIVALFGLIIVGRIIIRWYVGTDEILTELRKTNALLEKIANDQPSPPEPERSQTPTRSQSGFPPRR